MARGNAIIVSSQPRGNFMEGYVATAEKPGTVLQRDATVALKGGRHTYKVYQPGADGENPLGGYWILLPNDLLGAIATTAYAAGDRCFLYAPINGEEYNLIVENLSGTGDDHALGEKLMLNHASGKLIATTGTPENEVAQLLEVITDPTADTLAWVEWAG